MAYLDMVQALNRATGRDYRQRVVEFDKAACAEVALRYGQDYWDGDRRHGYGGYRYDGRWLPIARALAAHYQLRAGHRILDVGCGKGFLLHDLTVAVPGVQVAGVDISEYAVARAKDEVRPSLRVGNAMHLPWPDRSFDLVLSINTLHNLKNFELRQALQEIERVATGKAYVVVESYRNEREKANLLYWQLTCRAFYMPDEWEWLMKDSGYTGDFGCIFFE